MRQSITRRLQQSVPTSATRRSAALGAAIAAAGLSAPSLAATFTYSPTEGTTDLWSVGTNWNAVPVSAATTELVFGANATTFPNGFVNTSTNDIAGPFQLNILSLNGTGAGGGPATININSIAPSTGLNFISNGSTAPVINFNAVGPAGTLVYNINTPIALSNNLSVNGSGTGTLNFTGNITAAGNQNFTVATAAPVTYSNGTSTLTSGTLAVSGTNGNFTISSGSFQALNVQLTGSGGTFNQTGGTLTSQFDSRLSLSNSKWNTTGGTFNFNKMVIGANSGATNAVWTVGGNAVVNQNQNVGANNHELWVGGNNGGSGSLIVKDNAVFNGGARLNNGTFVFIIGNNGVGNGTVTIQDNAQMTFTGVAGNNSALIRVADLVNNTGTLNLNGSGTLSTLGLSKGAGVGTVNADGGTIRALASNVNFFANFSGTGGTQSVNLLTNGLKFDTNGFNPTVTNVLSGAGGLTKQNSGTLTLTGASTYTGNTVVNGGTLLVNGIQSAASGSPTISTAAGATLGGTGTVAGALNHTAGTITGATAGTVGTLTVAGDVTLNGGTTLVDVNGALITGSGNNSGAGDQIQANGNLAFGATPETVNFNFTNAAALPGAFTYKVFGYTGTLSGTPNLLFTSNLGRTQFTTNTATAGEVAVNVTPITGNLRWNSTASNVWDVQTTNNFFNTATNAVDVFFNGDAVTFGDNNPSSTPPNGQLQTTVSLATALSPSAVTVSANANNYTFTGPGSLAGPGTLAVTGNSTLTVLTNNTYSGGTTINSGGTIQLGDGTGTTGTLGSGAVVNNGTLVTNFTAGTVVLPNAISGNGGLTKNGLATLSVTGSNTYSGTTTVNNGTLQLDGTGSLNGSGAIVNNASIIAAGNNTLGGNLSGGGILATNGSGALTLTGNNSAYTGDTVVTAGTTLRIGNGGTTGTVPGGNVNVLGTLAYNRSDSVNAGPLNFTGTLSQVGPAGSTLTLGGDNVVGQANVGLSAITGNIIVPSGASLTVGTAGTGSLNVGVSTNAAHASGVLDASAASSFNVNVANFNVGVTANSGGVGTGTLRLSGNNTITATTAVLVGDSGGTRAGDNNVVVSTLTTAAGGSTTMATPLVSVGRGKSTARMELGAGHTLTVVGTGVDGRATFHVNDMVNGGGGGSFSATADFSAGVFNGTLNSLHVGNQAYSLGSSVNNAGVMILSNSPANHLDISGPSASATGDNAAVVAVGRVEQVLNTGSQTGTLTIGNLDATSVITSTNNGTAIVVGGGLSATSTGTLNLNGGTLKLVTTGSGIAGGLIPETAPASTVTTSNVNFNGTTLVAGAPSTTWIQNITNANIGTGGLIVDTGGFDVTVPQAFNSAGGDGGITKKGPGTLTLTGNSSYTGTTKVQGGVLRLTIASGAASAALNNASGADIQNGGIAFDYTGGSSPVGTIRSLLAASFQAATTPGVMDNGQLFSSTATNVRGLGYRDDGTSVLVKAALFGDADLDGGVSINDFNVLAANFGQASGRVWTDGDFDYDGGVSINDFNLLAGGFGQTLPANSDAWAGLLAFAAAPQRPGGLRGHHRRARADQPGRARRGCRRPDGPSAASLIVRPPPDGGGPFLRGGRRFCFPGPVAEKRVKGSRMKSAAAFAVRPWQVALLAVLLLANLATAQTADVVNYPKPAVYTPSKSFTLKANGVTIPVIGFSNDYDYAVASVTSGACNFEVTRLDGKPIKRAEVSPRKMKIATKVTGSKLSFTVDGPQYLIVDIDGIRRLAIATDAPQPDAPAARGEGIFNVTDPAYGFGRAGVSATKALQQTIDAAAAKKGIAYVPAGVYGVTQLVLPSDVSLYLAPGAVLRVAGERSDFKKQFHKDSTGHDGFWFISTTPGAKNVKIFGRGTIDGDGKANIKRINLVNHLVVPMNADNFVMDGVILRDAGLWGTVIANSENVRLTNTKHFNYLDIGEDDCVDVCNSRNVTIKRSIAISLDDPYSTKTWGTETDISKQWSGEFGPNRDILIEDCLAWTRCFSFKIGAGVFHPQENITIRNCVSFDGAHAIGISHSYGNSDVRNVTFDGIDAERTTCDVLGRSWARFAIDNKKKDSEQGGVYNIVVRNFRVYDPGTMAVPVRGRNEKRQIHGITFENILMRDSTTPAKTLEEIGIPKLEFANDIVIKP